MQDKTDRDSAQSDGVTIVTWSDSLSTGIELVDEQHKRLFDLTNQLHKACRLGKDQRDSVFKEVMSGMVEYVRFHFATEEELFQRTKYPKYAEHKSEHDSLTKRILETAKDYKEGKPFVPNNFVRSLKNWIVHHVAVSDKMFAMYYEDQKRKGMLTETASSG